MLKEPSNTVLRRIFRETYIHASSVYGDSGRKSMIWLPPARTPEDDGWQTLLQEFNEFRPEDMSFAGAVYDRSRQHHRIADGS